jgi:hypothetical protein
MIQRAKRTEGKWTHRARVPVNSPARHALEVDGDSISKVLGNRGGVDSEQGVEAKTMAR